MIPLSVEEYELCPKQKICHIYKREFVTDIDNNTEIMFMKYCRVRDHCYYTVKYRGAAHNIYNLRYKTPKKITIVFHNGSTNNYHFIIKELAEECKGQFECLGENT